MLSFRLLEDGDQARLEAFLLPRIAASMFLLSNSRAVGLIDAPLPLRGSYAAAFDGAQLVGVLAHYWNDHVILQVPPEHASELCRFVLGQSKRSLAGLLGPRAQVTAVLSGLGIGVERLRLDSVEGLYHLHLAELRVPPALTQGEVQARAARDSDLDLLSAWRVAYCVEGLNEPDTPQLHKSSREAEERGIRDGHIWLAEQSGVPVACSGFNAATVEAVQIGGVYTPPALRGRGYARAAVAQSLLDARARGVASSLLFTGEDNHAAQRAYLALGFRRVGDYRLSTLTEALAPR